MSCSLCGEERPEGPERVAAHFTFTRRQAHTNKRAHTCILSEFIPAVQRIASPLILEPLYSACIV